MLRFLSPINSHHAMYSRVSCGPNNRVLLRNLIAPTQTAQSLSLLPLSLPLDVCVSRADQGAQVRAHAPRQLLDVVSALEHADNRQLAASDASDLGSDPLAAVNTWVSRRQV